MDGQLIMYKKTKTHQEEKASQQFRQKRRRAELCNKEKRDPPGIESSECSNEDSKGLNRVEEKSSKNIISVRFPLRAIEFL